ncbi:hypothetical protein VB773_22270 [Haloarculaceae archaeon H-GB2-1]|nr:hypothetical protein [Haloarculaceae archaeon H-GB1-1]MEA5389520.1 hypothetical protein [Haloarculaceae archaeon H-GB11]MEA5410026.1 hypothetical protein [Haloarculaceae archaeon H-GB2-1]
MTHETSDTLQYPVEHCATCDETIDVNEWHVAATDCSSDGETAILSFCCKECRDRWKQE